MFRRTAFALLLSATTFTFAAQAAWSGGGTVRVSGTAPAVKFNGTVDFTVSESDGKLVFTGDLANTLKMGPRQEHTQEEFKTKKYTTALITIDKSKLKLPESDGETSGTVGGKLKLLDKEKPVTITYTAVKSGRNYEIKTATFSFKYTDFVPKICKFKVVCVNEPIFVEVVKAKIAS